MMVLKSCRTWFLTLTLLFALVMVSSARAQADSDVLRVAVTAFQAEVFDPTLHSTLGAYQYLIYDVLVNLNSQGTALDPDTSLAYEWEASDGNKVWTFHLRDDVYWWDGEQVTAEDVKFSVIRYMRPETRASRVDSIESALGGIDEAEERIEVLDDHTVRFNLKEAIFYWPEMLSPFWSSAGVVVPKHWVDENGEQLLSTDPMGSGPYRLVESVAGNMQRFEAVNGHAFREPTYESIELLQVAEESTRLAMLQTGEVDLAEMSVERLPQLREAGMEIVRKPSGILWSILFIEPYQDAVLAKREVRRAIMMAIDKQTLNEAFFDGVAELTNDGGNIAQVGEPSVRRDVVPYDPEAARGIVAREVPEDYELRIHAVIRGPIKMDHVEAIAAMLTNVGFDVEIGLAADYSTFRGNWGEGTAGPGLYLKDARRRLLYYPSIYAGSPENGGRHSVIQVPPGPETREVDPAIAPEDLETLRAFDEELEALSSASNWDEYWQTFSQIMDSAVDQIAPGSGLFFTPAIFAARPEVLPEWPVELGTTAGLWLPNLAEEPVSE
ncbi:MAG: ABC transporter substrate-binding protein [Trueperaceae bacterium]